MWCLQSAIWRKCGSECRNGCELWGLRGGLRRLVVAVSDLSVVVLCFVVMFGLFPVGNGGLRDWFVSFSCVEKEKDALRRPQK